MARLVLSLLLLTAALLTTFSAQAQTRKRRPSSHYATTRAKYGPDGAGQKLAPGMRLGMPMPLTTDYMGRPIKPKNKLTSTPVAAKRTTATSMSAGASKSSARKRR
ncbi:hypothetical protein F0P96_09550 [Hymenobacter busanensis]|uniref:Uncharacterized protein n=1 Tax=Hymenobacter busanensis TaxID=2607656 RepID=A0A7L4ZXX3_9BACT|nr:hypothetical protein [Hymenobacter busanensis]KAA9333212.1 hypothetical protein F0P96_09550 [Hymenobacter busanensis]QHJ08111.1 hypothetical protein GUY19_12770 [Hymenobacter busanensis]